MLGADAKRYFVQLLYQVHLTTFGVHQPPEGFHESSLWRGSLVSSPIPIRVGGADNGTQ